MDTKNKLYYRDQGAASRAYSSGGFMPDPPYKGWQGKAWKKGWETADKGLRDWFNFRWSRFHCV